MIGQTFDIIPKGAKSTFSKQEIYGASNISLMIERYLVRYLNTIIVINTDLSLKTLKRGEETGYS